jgi:ABC-type amino acid transport substrate-binding protein
MRNSLLLSLLLFVCLSCSGPEESTIQQVENTGILRVGTDATYPPFEMINTETGQPEGFDIDMITAICTRLGWKPQFVVTPFDGIVPGLKGKKYDLILSAFTITPERAEAVLFSDPYYDAGQSIAVPLDNSDIHSVADLRGKTVGVQLGTTGEQMARSLDGVNVVSFENIGAAFIDMENGKIDAVLNDVPTSTMIINSRGKARLVGKILSDEKYGMAVRRSDTALVVRINGALAELKAAKFLDSLQAKWFSSQ